MKNKEVVDFELRRSKRARVEKEFGPDFYVFNVENDPLTLKEALFSHDSIFLERGCKWWNGISKFLIKLGS